MCARHYLFDVHGQNGRLAGADRRFDQSLWGYCARREEVGGGLGARRGSDGGLTGVGSLPVEEFSATLPWEALRRLLVCPRLHVSDQDTKSGDSFPNVRTYNVKLCYASGERRALRDINRRSVDV